MARELLLYTDVAPNRNEATHFVFSTVSQYLNALPTPALTIPFDNYRINEGRVLAKLDANNFPLPIVSHITYIVERDTAEANFLNCFFVLNSYDQSDYAVFNIETDYWASHMLFANFSHIHVTRSNYSFAHSGIFDEPEATKLELEIINHGQTLNKNQVCLIVEMQYNVSQGVFGNDQISKTSLFAFNLDDIYAAVHGINGNFDNLNIITKAVDFIGSLYALRSGGVDFACQVLRTWLVPASVVTNSGVTLKNFVFKGYLTGSNDYVWTSEVPIVKANHFTYPVLLSTLLGNYYDWEDVFPQYKAFLGAYYRGLEMTRFVDGSANMGGQAFYHFVFSNSSLQVLVQYGELMNDITPSFEVELTTNNGTLTALEKGAKAMQEVTTAILAVAAGFKTGGVVGGVVGGAVAGIKTLTEIKPAPTLASIGSGDGACCFDNNSPSTLKLPFAITIVESNYDEEAKAYHSGVKFDEYINAFPTGNGTICRPLQYYRLGYYIACDRLVLEGVPMQAERYIRDELARGVWVRVLQ